MAKSARKIITAPVTVVVENFKQITEDLGVISYKNENHERVDDLYNINAKTDMEALEHVAAGKKVEVVLHPDGSDNDTHPEAKNARVLE